jgi:hypothetical protein
MVVVTERRSVKVVILLVMVDSQDDLGSGGDQRMKMS